MFEVQNPDFGPNIRGIGIGRTCINGRSWELVTWARCEYERIRGHWTHMNSKSNTWCGCVKCMLSTRPMDASKMVALECTSSAARRDGQMAKGCHRLVSTGIWCMWRRQPEVVIAEEGAWSSELLVCRWRGIGVEGKRVEGSVVVYAGGHWGWFGVTECFVPGHRCLHHCLVQTTDASDCYSRLWPTADFCLSLLDRTMTAKTWELGTLDTCLPIADPSQPPTGRGLTKLLTGAHLCNFLRSE